MSALSCASSASRKHSATSMSDYCSTLHTAVSSSRSSLALSDEYYETSSERLSPRATSSDPVLGQSTHDDLSFSNRSASRSDSSEHIRYYALVGEDDGPDGDDGESGVQSTRSDSCISEPSVSSDFRAQLLASLRLMGLLGSSDHIFMMQDSYQLENRIRPSAPTTTPRMPESPSSIDSFASEVPSETGEDEDDDEDLVTPRPVAVQLPTQPSKDSINQTLVTHDSNLNHHHNVNHVSPQPEDESESHPSSVSEAKRLILENLAQLSRGELFSRPVQSQPPALPSTSPSNHNITNRPVISPIGTPVASNTTTNRPRIGRLGSIGSSSSRKRLESLLRIDLELQPLNLRLSRLLAEFRAEFYGQLARRESCCPRLLAACASSSNGYGRRKLAARACRSCGDNNPGRLPVLGNRPPKRRFWEGSAPGSRPTVSLKELIGVNSSSLAEQISRSAMINYSNEDNREHREQQQQQRKQRGIGANLAERIESARSGSLMISGRSWRTLVPRSELVN